jgi:serine/threonine protein kinase
MPIVNPGELQVGSLFQGRYQIVRRIKVGGMGAVYEVIHLETRRRRALKVMLPSLVSDPGLRARFKAEATVAADVHSEHIVETFDAGVDPETGTPFIVMELLKGEELADILKRQGRLLPRQVITLLGQAALALDATHAAGIVHRDLKPENLFLTRRDDGSPRLKILDYGIAKVVAGDGTAVTQAMGTPLYMPPEQMRGESTLGPASDNYALAHVAYKLLVNAGYWDHERETIGLSWILRIFEGLPEPASVRAARHRVLLPPRFDAWFQKATALDPAARYQRASELIAALAAALEQDQPISFASTVASDTRSISAIVRALYTSISGPRRDVARLRSLFMPHATLSRVDPRDGPRAALVVMTVDQFVAAVDTYVAAHAYHEQELARRVERFGHIAHIVSTYESTYELGQSAGPGSSRGLKSLQLFWDGDRWWIASMLWDTEGTWAILPDAYVEGTSVAASSSDLLDTIEPLEGGRAARAVTGTGRRTS